MDTYTLTVEIDGRYKPGLRGLVDVVADELERHGIDDRHYRVEVHGPPELRLVVKER